MIVRIAPDLEAQNFIDTFNPARAHAPLKFDLLCLPASRSIFYYFARIGPHCSTKKV
ncbi:hypothetical protein L0337_25940 [candidate division KSB1 bacterium]|nr:hypothetical protein [candidate division KSB1 bacterium]